MRFVRLAIWKWWRFLAACTWWGFGLWATLAIFFTAPGPGWVGYLLAALVAALFLAASRERFHFYQWRGLTWREKRVSSLALASAGIVLIYYVGFVVPDPNEEWSLEQSRMPIVKIEGDKVHVQNVRNFT